MKSAGDRIASDLLVRVDTRRQESQLEKVRPILLLDLDRSLVKDDTE
jgi:hypothetical protein